MSAIISENSALRIAFYCTSFPPWRWVHLWVTLLRGRIYEEEQGFPAFALFGGTTIFACNRSYFGEMPWLFTRRG